MKRILTGLLSVVLGGGWLIGMYFAEPSGLILVIGLVLGSLLVITGIWNVSTGTARALKGLRAK